MDIGWQILTYSVGFFSMLGIIYGNYRYCKQLENRKKSPEEKNNFLKFNNYNDEDKTENSSFL
jgi:hypothetical protein